MYGHALNPHSNPMGQLHYRSWFVEEKSAEGLLYYCSRLAPWPAGDPTSLAPCSQSWP